MVRSHRRAVSHDVFEIHGPCRVEFRKRGRGPRWWDAVRVYERHKDAEILIIRLVPAYEMGKRLIRSQAPTNRDERRRLGDAELSPEQRATVEARRADRQTSQYQDELARYIEAYRQKYPPVGDPGLIESVMGRPQERQRQGLNLTDIAERRESTARRSVSWRRAGLPTRRLVHSGSMPRLSSLAG
jgi:hypothetical protein